MKSTELKVVIVTDVEPMNENEIKAAFKGNGRTPMFKALIQIISEDRHTEALNAAASAEGNNALAMASAFGAYKNASGLLSTLITYTEG